MNARSSRYDPELQMFVEQAREPNLARLCFLRWLCEHNRLEHGTAGAPRGEYAFRPFDEPPPAA